MSFSIAPGKGRAAAIVAALVLLAGCQQLRLTEPLRPSRSDAVPPPPLEQAWRTDVGAAFGPLALQATNDLLLVATRAGDVSIVTSEGRERGRVRLGNSIEGPIAVVDGRRIVVALDGTAWGVVAYDLMEGRVLWRALRHVAHPAGVVVAAGVAVAPARDGWVRGLDADTGEERWRFQADADTAAFVAPPILLGDGSVAVADIRGRVAALDPATGRPRWRADVGAPVYTAMAVGERLLVVPTTRSTLAALDAGTGVPRWTRTGDAPRVRFGVPTVTGGAVFVGATDGRFRRLDAATGEETWGYPSDGAVSAAPLVAGGVVYVGTMDERLVALDAASGAERWALETEGRIRSMPVLFGGLLVVGMEPQHVRAYRPMGAVAARAGETR